VTCIKYVMQITLNHIRDKHTQSTIAIMNSYLDEYSFIFLFKIGGKSMSSVCGRVCVIMVMCLIVGLSL
jgi:hypothetical protein